MTIYQDDPLETEDGITRACLSILTEKQKKVLLMRHAGKSWAKTAKSVGLSMSRCQQIESEAVMRCRAIKRAMKAASPTSLEVEELRSRLEEQSRLRYDTQAYLQLLEEKHRRTLDDVRALCAGKFSKRQMQYKLRIGAYDPPKGRK